MFKCQQYGNVKIFDTTANGDFKGISNQYFSTRLSNLILPFPLKVSHHVWMIDHLLEKPGGASPYLVKGRHEGKEVSVIVDVPTFSPSAIQAI